MQALTSFTHMFTHCGSGNGGSWPQAQPLAGTHGGFDGFLKQSFSQRKQGTCGSFDSVRMDPPRIGSGTASPVGRLIPSCKLPHVPKPAKRRKDVEEAVVSSGAGWRKFGSW